MSGFSLRYARALFQVGLEEGSGQERKYGQLLSSFITGLKKSPELRVFLSGFHINKLRKKRLLSEIFNDPEDVRFLNFLKVLVDKERMNIIDRIGLDYRRLELDAQKTLECVIESAFPLDEATIERINQTFKQRTGAHAILSIVHLVPELIGGVRVVIGSTVYDGSMQSELDRLYEKMRK